MWIFDCDKSTATACTDSNRLSWLLVGGGWRLGYIHLSNILIIMFFKFFSY